MFGIVPVFRPGHRLHVELCDRRDAVRAAPAPAPALMCRGLHLGVADPGERSGLLVLAERLVCADRVAAELLL
ncbi:hypothetical protein FTUN_6295 [Frigoriglobus tundricola]|uniref:Uncharacterized protein n=1 Tax=Frigoriglobus tundricola TaxID=2774151 RepID=A0A6M5YZ23_9BACT|nr:hypothetical protein FTUN_6295 [Frigoriglobus tundricola]